MSRMTAVAPAPASIGELAGVYAHRITAALPLLWARRVSMHDSRGMVRWQSADVCGPAERDAVRLALERFVGNSAPTRADHELPEQRTAVLLRAADAANVFRGFIMLVVDNRRLRGKGQSAHDLPVPVQRAAHDWAMRLAATPNTHLSGGSSAAELTAVEADWLLASAPTVDAAHVDEFFGRLRALPLALVAQPFKPLQRAARTRRYQVFLREGAPSLINPALADRQVVGALIAWLAKHAGSFADEPSRFSVQLSASSIADPNFLRFVELCIATTRIPPALLAFEVEESHLRRDRERVERLTSGFEAMGVGLVIDNCTLQADTPELLGLPAVELVKFDRPLTQHLGTSRVAQMRLAGLAQMALVAGVQTVAKRVDSLEEQELLRATGVDFIQGTAAAVPLPLPVRAVEPAVDVHDVMVSIAL